MKTRAFLLSLSIALIGGCAGGSRPAPGMASLRVHVVAEPKEGRKAAVMPISTYDSPAAVKRIKGSSSWSITPTSGISWCGWSRRMAQR